MKNGVAVALIVVGLSLILGPLAVHAYNSNREKDRIAEFYKMYSPSAVVPAEMKASGYTIYDWGSFLVGVLLTGAGALRSRASA